jgi:hypothetical protein
MDFNNETRRIINNNNLQEIIKKAYYLKEEAEKQLDFLPRWWNWPFLFPSPCLNN